MMSPVQMKYMTIFEYINDGVCAQVSSLQMHKVIKLYILLCLTVVTFVFELILGYYTGSVVLIADSFHSLSDVVALSIALYATRLSDKKESTLSQRTFGWQRAETLGALVNSIFLLTLCFTIGLQAIQRIIEPTDVKDPMIIFIAGCCGFIVNLAGLLIVHNHSHDSDQLNMRGVFLHIMGDTLASIGVIVNALILWLSRWPFQHYVDPIISIIIAFIIVFTTYPLFRRTADIVLHIVPTSIPIQRIRNELLALEGVHNIHEFHVWQLSDVKTISSVHITTKCRAEQMKIIQDVKKIFHSWGIYSSTIQIEIIDDETSVTQDVCVNMCCENV